MIETTEQTVVRIWTGLGLRPTSPEDDFFELGGQSLALVGFMARVQQELGVELPVDTLFDEDLTVAAAARAIDDALLAAADPDDLAAALASLDQPSSGRPQ
jgi:acyl carrier protein